MTTAASMIACVNAFVGAAGLTLFLTHLLDLQFSVALSAGAVFALAQVLATYRYQKTRIERVMRLAESAGLKVGDDGLETKAG